MLNIKPGVRLAGVRPELLIAIIAAERVCAAAGHDLTITAGVDGRHMPASLHYAGAAFDLRTRDLAAEDVPKIVEHLKACLADDFDVVIENDHIHVEYQPKQPLTA